MTLRPDMAAPSLVSSYLLRRCHGRLSRISMLLRHLLRRRPRHPDQRRIPPPPIDCWVSPLIRRHSLARLGPRSLRPPSFHPSRASPTPPPPCRALPPRPPSTPQEERPLSRSTSVHNHAARASSNMARARRSIRHLFISGNIQFGYPPIDCCVSPSSFDAAQACFGEVAASIIAAGYIAILDKVPSSVGTHVAAPFGFHDWARVRHLCPPPIDC